jgi:hypothetical protein
MKSDSPIVTKDAQTISLEGSTRCFSRGIDKRPASPRRMPFAKIEAQIRQGRVSSHARVYT